jgi:hypothetical protein
VNLLFTIHRLAGKFTVRGRLKERLKLRFLLSFPQNGPEWFKINALILKTAKR